MIGALKGDILRRLERHEEALNSYDRALEIKPDYFQGWTCRGDVLVKLERYDKALKSYDRALEIKPDYFQGWMRRAATFAKLERYDKALKSYDRALEIKPDYDYAWRGKGTIFYQLGKFEESYICFKEVGRIAAEDEESFNNQGYLILVQCSYGLQPVFGKPLLVRQTQYSEVSNDTIAVNLDRCKKSLAAFNRAVTLDPQFVLAWANRCFPAYYLEDYQTALDSCNRAIELDPKNEQKMNEVIYTNKGCVQLRMGSFSESLQSFSTALSIDSALAEAWIGKGTALYDLGRYSKAFDSFTQAQQLNHPLAQRSLKLIRQHLSLPA